MEELQDAIEDAQYVNAIVTQEDGPRPTLPWIVPTEEQLQEWRDQVRKHHFEQHQQKQETTSSTIFHCLSPSSNHAVVEPFSMEWTLQSAIGYFLWSAYIKTRPPLRYEDYLRMNFCEEVLRWKKLRGKPRLEKARRIVSDYLQPVPVIVVMEKTTITSTTTAATNTVEVVPTTATTTPVTTTAATPESSPSPEEEETKEGPVDGGGDDDNDDSNHPSTSTTNGANATNNKTTSEDQLAGQKVYKYPPMTEIDEYDLERPIPTMLTTMTSEEFNRLYEENVHLGTTACAVGLDGPVRNEIVRQMQDMERKRLELRKQRQESRRSMLMKQQKQECQHQSSSQKQVSTRSAFSAVTATTEEASSMDFSPAKTTAAAATPTVSSLLYDDDDDGAPVGGCFDNDKEDDDLAGSSMIADDASISVMSRNSNCSLFKQNQLQSLRLLMAAESKRDGSAATPEDKRFLPPDLFDKAEALVMESLKRQYWNEFCTSGCEQYAKLNMFLWNQYRPVVLEDFLVMRVLGRGGFGLVTACKKGTSGKLYAMKIMNKRRIKMKKSEQLALNERKVLAAVESPFVLNLKYSFHSKDDVYLVLDLMTGGDLGYHLHQKGRFPKRESQYFAARIMLGLQALHDKQYVYRDLKPENCLLADDGRVKITDLGLATKMTPTLHGAAGTRGYWAPEMLRRDKKGKRMPYGHTVDWFSFGCCVAEFICGYNPFRSEAALKFGLERGHQTKDKAIDCATMEMDPGFDPSYFEPDAADLCRKLLDKNENTRLGNKGCEEIMCHPWFKNVNWEMIITDRKKPPFTPPQDVNAASQSEIGTFAEDKDTIIDEKDEEHYKDWDWTNPRAFAAEVIEFLIYERETGEPLVPMPQNPTCCCGIL